MHKVYLFSPFSSVLVMSCLLDNSHSHGPGMIACVFFQKFYGFSGLIIKI